MRPERMDFMMARFCFVFFLLFFLTLPAYSSMPNDDDPLFVQLLPGKAYISAGEEIWIGLKLDLAPDWHSYAEDPGDTGLPPRIEWTLPAGFMMGPLQFPPAETIKYQELTNYGYHDQVTFLQKLKAPEELPAGPITFTADTTILVCKKICIPVHGTYALTLNDPTQNISHEAEIKTVLAHLEPQNTLKGLTLLSALGFALLGGLILNLMPCVFPVLSMKALSLVKLAHDHPQTARGHGLSYMAGVVLSFLAIAGALLLLKSGGQAIGWGFQLQNPLVVGALAYLLFIVGLNLSGVFNLPVLLGRAHVPNKTAYSSSFFTGMLATLVATPCTAPFMAAAVGFALTQDALTALSIFVALGVGLALPYTLLAFIPALQHVLPKPGPWMVRFKHILAWPMFASAAWLVWVIGQQAGDQGVALVISGLALITFGFWVLRKHRILAGFLFVGAMILLPAGLSSSGQYHLKPPPPLEELSADYDPILLDSALEGDRPIFVEMGAAWCITCKTNHAFAIDRTSTRALFDKYNMRYLYGDWTNYDADITAYLHRFGRSGVPLYIYYPPRDQTGARAEPVILPQLLTPAIVRGVIEE